MNSELASEEREATLMTEPPQPLKLDVCIVPEVDLDRLTASKTAKCFDSHGFERGIAWLKGAQRFWGIGEVVRESIQEFARRIVARHISGAG